MEPRDESLLQDLLDDRLDEAEAADVRRRLESESELKDAWDDLIRLRVLLRDDRGVRAPRDFLTRVRQRIAVLPDEEHASAASPAHPWWRWKTTISAAAALLLVALSARLIFLGDAPAEEPPVESARLDRMAEDKLAKEPDDGTRRARAAGEIQGLRGPSTRASRRAAAEAERLKTADGSPAEGSGPVDAPAAPAPVPARRPGAYLPGDAVPPGLREPTDEAPPRPAPSPAAVSQPVSGPKGGAASTLGGLAPAPVVDGRARARGTALRDAEAPPVYTLEAGAFDEGRAELALLVHALREAVGREEREAAGRKKREAPLYRLTRSLVADAKEADGRTVLGTVVLELTPEEADRLAQWGERLARPRDSTVKAPATTPASGAPSAAPAAPAAPPTPPTPPTPTVPPASEAVAGQPEPMACEPVEEAEDASRRVRIRVVVVKRR